MPKLTSTIRVNCAQFRTLIDTSEGGVANNSSAGPAVEVSKRDLMVWVLGEGGGWMGEVVTWWWRQPSHCWPFVFVTLLLPTMAICVIFHVASDI